MTQVPWVHLHPKVLTSRLLGRRLVTRLIVSGRLRLGMPETNDIDTAVEPKIDLADEIFWMRKELEEFRAVIFDHTELLGRLGFKIEAWLQFPPPSEPGFQG